MRKEIVKYILKMFAALLILIAFGVAGEWDYQDHMSHQNQTTKY